MRMMRRLQATLLTLIGVSVLLVGGPGISARRAESLGSKRSTRTRSAVHQPKGTSNSRLWSMRGLSAKRG